MGGNHHLARDRLQRRVERRHPRRTRKSLFDQRGDRCRARKGARGMGLPMVLDVIAQAGNEEDRYAHAAAALSRGQRRPGLRSGSQPFFSSVSSTLL